MLVTGVYVAGQPTIARLKVTRADMLWGTAADEYVSLVAKCTVGRRAVTKKTLVRVSTRTHSVFVQTDKPIYTPRQTGEWIYCHCRSIAFSQDFNTIQIKYNTIHVQYNTIFTYFGRILAGVYIYTTV